jgi:hypothetical protein
MITISLRIDDFSVKFILSKPVRLHRARVTEVPLIPELAALAIKQSSENLRSSNKIILSALMKNETNDSNLLPGNFESEKSPRRFSARSSRPFGVAFSQSSTATYMGYSCTSVVLGKATSVEMAVKRTSTPRG